jgi:uncharacterized protein with HEPN domain
MRDKLIYEYFGVDLKRCGTLFKHTQPANTFDCTFAFLATDHTVLEGLLT